MTIEFYLTDANDFENQAKEQGYILHNSQAIVDIFRNIEYLYAVDIINQAEKKRLLGRLKKMIKRNLE